MTFFVSNLYGLNSKILLNFYDLLHWNLILNIKYCLSVDLFDLKRFIIDFCKFLSKSKFHFLSKIIILFVPESIIPTTSPFIKSFIFTHSWIFLTTSWSFKIIIVSFTVQWPFQDLIRLNLKPFDKSSELMLIICLFALLKYSSFECFFFQYQVIL